MIRISDASVLPPPSLCLPAVQGQVLRLHVDRAPRPSLCCLDVRRWAGFSSSWLVALPPHSLCCWAGGFKWLLQLGQMSLPVGCSGWWWGGREEDPAGDGRSRLEGHFRPKAPQASVDGLWLMGACKARRVFSSFSGMPGPPCSPRASWGVVPPGPRIYVSLSFSVSLPPRSP